MQTNSIKIILITILVLLIFIIGTALLTTAGFIITVWAIALIALKYKERTNDINSNN